MAEYALTAAEHTVLHFHDDSVTSFRDDVDSRENEKYQAWLAEGNTPDPYGTSHTLFIDPELDSVGTGKTINQMLGVG